MLKQREFVVAGGRAASVKVACTGGGRDVSVRFCLRLLRLLPNQTPLSTSCPGCTVRDGGTSFPRGCVWGDAFSCWDPLKGTRVGEASNPGPTDGDASLAAAPLEFLDAYRAKGAGPNNNSDATAPPLSAKELARALGVTQSCVCHVQARARAKGLLQRPQGPSRKVLG